jgi:hypothetical protein
MQAAAFHPGCVAVDSTVGPNIVADGEDGGRGRRALVQSKQFQPARNQLAGGSEMQKAASIEYLEV